MLSREFSTGSTLVELVVASAVLGLAVTGAVALIGTGRGVDAKQTLERQAFQCAMSALEDSNLSYRHYPFTPGNQKSGTASLKIDGSHSVSADYIVVAANADSVTFLDTSQVTGARRVSRQLLMVKVRWPWGPSSSFDSLVFQKTIGGRP